MFRFNALSHASLIILLWWVKRWKPQGVSPPFSPFCNPLSLTPVESHTLMTKSWYCQELCKKLSNAYSKSDDGEGKIPNQLTIPIIRALDRKQKSDKNYPRGANPGGDKEKGFQKGRTLRGGRSPPLVVLLFCRSGKAAALEEVSKQ